MQLDCILEYRERREKSIFCNAIFKGRVHFLCTKVSFKKAFIKKIASNIQKGRFWTDTILCAWKGCTYLT